ncbi:EF-P 5-aminopentanol modification-associated protein YfmF [Streptococcus cuniculipharyngis]|uniref:Insulinase family protein n=1 Tax=Streptococcus cuniculipharyngis TaxID=1562651 RepID=A0A5C5SAU1_9STRE|nr:pitrilysin family protein [Streptococcus cuniculipharyngis]TWS97687.1 insulinase family protein [Streptococcus cuniculipharyngis]
MEIVKGVYLHPIKTKKFKNNHITCRFSSPLKKQSVARRALVAQILETANATYPSLQSFREKLAHLYGAHFSTQVSSKGQVHILDIDINFVADRYAVNGDSVLVEVFKFLHDALFNPLVSVVQYQQKLFQREKTNLIHAISSSMEDAFDYSDWQVKKLFFRQDSLALPPYAIPDLLQQETSYTAYQEFQKMLQEDQIDIFVVGDFDEYRVLQLIHQYPFEERHVELNYFYQQHYSNVVSHQTEFKPNQQSVLQLAYHALTPYGSKDYFSLLLLNGMLGMFSHSRLFTEIREKAGLSYQIGSHLDVYTGLLQVYSGIDASNRDRTLQLIVKQLTDFKTGCFSIDLIKHTKKMLKTSIVLLEDSPKYLVESTYRLNYCAAMDVDRWLTEIDKVSKAEIVKLAGSIKMQSVYFLEGV